jgi:hypothetical protein
VPAALLVHLGARSAELSPRRSLLLALELGQAPWLFFRIHRGRLAAGLFRGIVLFGSAGRTVLLLLAVPWLVAWPRAWARLRHHLQHALALLRWAVMPRRQLAEVVARLFASADVIATSPDFQRELARAAVPEGTR